MKVITPDQRKRAEKALSAILLAVILLSFGLWPVAQVNAQFPGEALGEISSGVGQFSQGLGAVGSAAGVVNTVDIGLLDVPTKVCITPVLCAAGAAIVSMNIKDLVDAAAVTLLKAVINATRDSIIRAILTGRFSKPVFSQNFNLDLKNAAENASRTFLNRLLDNTVNFCDGSRIPPEAFVNIAFNLSMTCQFNGQDYVAFQQGRVADFLALATSESDVNDYWNKTMNILDYKLQEEKAARNSFVQEYQAGRGYFGIRDQNGNVITPGSYVADYVRESNIVSEQRRFDVANTIQQAIDAVVTTAIKSVAERGFKAAFGR